MLSMAITRKVDCVMAAGFDALRDELGSSRASSVHQGLSLDVSYDEQDMVKVSVNVSSFLSFSVVVSLVQSTVICFLFELQI